VVYYVYNSGDIKIPEYTGVIGGLIPPKSLLASLSKFKKYKYLYMVPPKLKKYFVTALQIFVFAFIFQKILQYCLEIYQFNNQSFLRNLVFLCLCFEINRQKNNISIYSYCLLFILVTLYLYNIYLEKDPENIYLGQDILTLPLTSAGYYFMHLDKLQTNKTIINDYTDVYKPNISPYPKDKNTWYHYSHCHVGDVTYYIIFTSISKYDPNLRLWFHYGNHKTKESFHYNETFSLIKYTTSRSGEEFISKCKTENFDFKYVLDLSKDTFTVNFRMNNIDIVYNGLVQSKCNQFLGRVFPFSLLGYIIPGVRGQITADNDERFNDQLIIGKCNAIVNNVKHENCHFWNDTLMGINTYFMTTWLWVYQRSENFVIYTVWYSDPEYYNSEETVRIIYIFDTKNNKVILNGSTFPSDKKFVQFVGVSDCSIDTLGTSVRDKEFNYHYSFKTPNFSVNINSIEGSSIKVCDDKYMYERKDKSVNYENIEELMKVMEEVRYDEFCSKSTMNIIYNGKEYNETATVVVDSMTWKNNGWPSGYRKRNSSFFSYDHPFYTNDPKSNELNGKM